MCYARYIIISYHQKRRGTGCYPLAENARPLRIKPSIVKIPNRDYQNDAKKLVYATGDVATAELPAWPELALVEGGPKC